MKSKPKIHADFNNADPKGRIRLLDNWQQEDVDQLGFIPKADMVVEVTDIHSLSADGILRFSDSENIWVVEIDWNKLRYLDE